MILFSLAIAAMQPAPAAVEHRPVCIGRRLDECLDALRAHLKLNEEAVAAAKKGLDDVDVNGRHIYDQRAVRFTAFTPSVKMVADVEILFDPQGSVRQIGFDLRDNPLDAQTAEQYDETGLYPVMAAMDDGSGCAPGDRLALYRFFENVVKPTLRTTRNGNEERKTSAPQRLCGLSYIYRDIYGRSIDAVSLDNTTGIWTAHEIIFTAPSAGPVRAAAGARRRTRRPGTGR
ncbi:MAG TPA: hypothetical protein VFW19_02585 [Allosphingosinicella sp.]|nr:hypothetical protein [Allosphingosinicella sp.]